MTNVSEAVERVRAMRDGVINGTVDLTPDTLMDAFEAASFIAEEQRAQIARLTEQVRVASMALEPFARAAVEAERQTGTNETSGTTALCRAARGETAWADYVRARETLTRMEKNDG